jgi:hypothetical protein
MANSALLPSLLANSVPWQPSLVIRFLILEKFYFGNVEDARTHTSGALMRTFSAGLGENTMVNFRGK